MAEHFIISDGDKDLKYSVLYDQIKALVECEGDIIADMANISSMIQQTFGFWWTGFYRVCSNELVYYESHRIVQKAEALCISVQMACDHHPHPDIDRVSDGTGQCHRA